VKVATFNCEWRPTVSSDADIIRERVFDHNPDVVCFTEAYADFANGSGFTISSEEDYGYSIVPGRRKVLLWSKQPWKPIQSAVPASMPPGRFVAGTTATEFGDVDVIGVCIPWAHAHVKTGNRNREPWEDHRAYLAALDEWLLSTPSRTILVGDFNQRIPQLYQPVDMFRLLQQVVLRRFNAATSGQIEGADKQAIDHICHSPDLRSVFAKAISNMRPDGGRISDHFGAVVSIELA
jgi:exonuclease III